jgi:multidrug efflux system membrane fusion protein
VSYAFRVAGLVVASVCLISAIACNAGSSAAGSSTTPAAGGGRGGGRGAGGGIVPVVLGKVSQRDVPVDIASIGNVEAFSTISVRSQLTGTLTEVKFREGDYVKKDAVLFQIDPRPYQAALDQANANMARDVALETQAEAQLARDIASADYARAQAQRNDELMKRGIISKDQSDQTTSAAQAAEAGVNADRANIASAKAQVVSEQAAVDSAKLQLEYTVIRSPIDGRSGNLTIKAGNLVTANSTELVTLTQLDPIYVTFSMSAVSLPDIKQHMAQGQLAVSATPKTTGATPVTGTLTFVDNSVDPSTDTIRMKATFSNADHQLWPGQFSDVSVRLATIPHAIVVPTEAVQTGQDGQFVFVVKADSTVEQRTVTTGSAVDQDTVIKSGLNVGETVVTEGQLRLDAGTRVTRADPKTGEAAPAGSRGRGGRGLGAAGQGRNTAPAPAASNGSE